MTVDAQPPHADRESRAGGSERRETSLEFLDRNLEEMTGELRVVVTGVQVLFAFLLIVPFNTGFAHVGSFERTVYFVTLLLAALSAARTGTVTSMTARRTAQSNPRRRPQSRFYLLRGSVHCATGHNPLRMQGKTAKGNTYYACGYRSDYGDNAAEALGHGKWQYIREDRLTNLVEQFFATNIFGPSRLHHFRAQHVALATAVEDDKTTQQRTRLADQLADLDQRLQLQIAAIESGVDPVLVGERIRALETERHQAEAVLSELDLQQRHRPAIDIDGACSVLHSLPDLSKALAHAKPELQRRIFEVFHLRIELDRNAPHVRLSALVSSAFAEAPDLDSLAATVTDKAIAGEVCGCST